MSRLLPTLSPRLGESTLPVELNPEQRLELVRDFVKEEFLDRGMVADVAYHDGGRDNPHAHILLTTRELNSDGFGAKERSWNSKEVLAHWREEWAGMTNVALDRAGFHERIDHRTLAVQREEAIERGDRQQAEKLDRDPEMHLGKSAWMMAERGRGNERTRRNARIVEGNRAREMERGRGKEMIRSMQEKIDGLRQTVRRVIDKVRGPDLGPDRWWSR